MTEPHKTNAAYDEWIEAIPNYNKTKGHLRDTEGYCCLGVACELNDPSKWTKWSPGSLWWSYVSAPNDANNMVLTSELRDKLGIRTTGGVFSLFNLSDELVDKLRQINLVPKDGLVSLAEINDNTHDWSLVLEVLKARPRSLFV